MLPVEQHQVVAVGSRSSERAAEFAKKFSIAAAYGSYDELAHDKQVDIVYIGVIHPCHFPLIKLFLNTGKHVLCEKPLTINARQAREVVKLAREKGLFLMEGYWSRFFPVYKELHTELESGAIGDPRVVTANFGLVRAGKGWMADKKTGAGTWLGMGCYCVQLAQLVFKHEKPERIQASGILSESNGYDLSVTATLTYRDNRVANLMSSIICGLDQTATVYGAKTEAGGVEGVVRIPNFWSPEDLILPHVTHNHPVPKTSGASPPHVRGEGFMYQAQSVRECLLKGLTENPLLTLDQTIQILEINDEIRRQVGVIYEDDKP